MNGTAQPAPALTGRAFGMLRLPAGYGPLMLGGDISGDKSGPVSQRFVERSGGASARLVVLALGYAKSADAKAYAAFQANVAAPVQWFVLNSHADQAAIQGAIQGATGIFVTAPDQSLALAALNAAPAVAGAPRSAWQRARRLWPITAPLPRWAAP